MGGVTQEAATSLKNTCGTTRSTLNELLVEVFFLTLADGRFRIFSNIRPLEKSVGLKNAPGYMTMSTRIVGCIWLRTDASVGSQMYHGHSCQHTFRGVERSKNFESTLRLHPRE